MLDRLLTKAQLRQTVDREVEKIVAKAERVRGNYRSTIPDDELAAFLVDSRGVDLLEGSREGREVRRALVSTLDDQELASLYIYDRGASPTASRASRVRGVAQRGWHPGKSWPRLFVKIVGLPPAFAGVEGVPDGPGSEEVEPFIELPELHDYQRGLVQRLLTTLDADQGINRALLSLPTGAGKTRTAVEALLDWFSTGDLDSGFILWVAQSDELCEQAVQSFKEVWVDRGWKCHERRSLKIHRLWGTRGAPEAGGGVVIASIQKLDAATRNGAEHTVIDELFERTKVVVVDEAHHITAEGYLDVLRRLGIDSRQASRVPLIGLTATPYRGNSPDENDRLARFFGRNLLTPKGMDDPIGALRSEGILSTARHVTLETHRPFALTPREEQQMGRFQRLPESFLRRVGDDAARNELLLRQLLAIDSGTPTLFFGCSVDHARAMAVLLRRKGVTAAAVSATTRTATRRYLIEQFRNKQLQTLCNYGVLTTGFDAPQVQVIVISRPTTSPVLYEQMIGRGMRGPKNGGTEDCLVIDLVDNITRFQGQMAYKRYSEYWVKEELGSVS